VVIFIFVLLASCFPFQDQPAVPAAVESITSELAQIRALDNTLNSMLRYTGNAPPQSEETQKLILQALDAYHVFYIFMETRLAQGDKKGFEAYRKAAGDQLGIVTELLFPTL